MAKTHFETVSHRKDGSFALASSSLTGRTWDGSLWVFSNIEDFRQCPVLNNVATKTASGISDLLWLSGETDIVVASDSGEVEVWNCHPPGNTLEYKASLGSHDDMALCLCRTADQERVISGGADARVTVWDVNNKRMIKSCKGHTELVYSVTAHPTNRDCFMSTSKDGYIRCWDLRKPKPASTFQARNGGTYTSLSWCPTDEHSLALGSESGTVEMVDMRDAKGFLFACYSLHQRQVHRMTFAPWESSLLATVSNDTDVRVINTKNGTTVYSSSAHVDFVHGVSWHPSEHVLVTCAWDGQVLQHTVDAEAIDGEARASSSETKKVNSDADQSAKSTSCQPSESMET